jgi:membrane-bound lytic murein transglycosylase A
MPPELRRFFEQGRTAKSETEASRDVTRTEHKGSPIELTLGGQKLTLTPVAFTDIGGWQDDEQQEALKAFRDSCVPVLRMQETAPMRPEGLGGTAADWKAACQEAFLLVEADKAVAKAFFEKYFSAYEIGGDKDKPAFYTGYFQYSMKAELRKTATAQIPIYAVPSDLVKADPAQLGAPAGPALYGRRNGDELVPYHTREEIEEGAISDKARVLAYAYDRVDVFFLQVQGSGVLNFSDGSSRQVGFAAKNGQPYHAIGKVLVEQGELEKENVTAASIQAWLRANPGKATAVMRANPSYVFFEWKEGDAAIGAAGVPLTAERSLAVDRALVPMAMPIWVDTVTPEVGPKKAGPYRRLVVAQDTGSAITGPGRADIFWGHGEEAAAMAGAMKSPGEMLLLLPKTRAEAISSSKGGSGAAATKP